MTLGVRAIHVEDHGADAALIERAEGTVLVIRPGQTVGSAVAAIAALLPWAGRDYITKIVREHLPHALDLADVLPPPAVCPAPPEEPLSFPRRVKVAVAAAVLLIVGGFACIHQPYHKALEDLDHSVNTTAGLAP